MNDKERFLYEYSFYLSSNGGHIISTYARKAHGNELILNNSNK